VVIPGVGLRRRLRAVTGGARRTFVEHRAALADNRAC